MKYGGNIDHYIYALPLIMQRENGSDRLYYESYYADFALINNQIYGGEPSDYLGCVYFSSRKVVI